VEEGSLLQQLKTKDFLTIAIRVTIAIFICLIVVSFGVLVSFAGISVNQLLKVIRETSYNNWYILFFIWISLFLFRLFRKQIDFRYKYIDLQMIFYIMLSSFVGMSLKFI
jgi:hypothetical protein